EGAGVDLREQLALAHELPLAEVHLEQLAVHAAAHGDGVERGDGAQRAEGDGEIARAGDGGDDGGGTRARSRRGAATAPARLPFAGAGEGVRAAGQDAAEDHDHDPRPGGAAHYAEDTAGR